MPTKHNGSANSAVIAHDSVGRFGPGNSEYFAKKARIADRIAQLAADYDPSPSQRQLLPIIARNLDDAERGRTANARVRAANAANRLLRSLRKRRAAPLPATLKEALAAQ